VKNDIPSTFNEVKSSKSVGSKSPKGKRKEGYENKFNNSGNMSLNKVDDADAADYF